MQAFHNLDVVFDDLNLIGATGLVPVSRLAERAGLHGLLGRPSERAVAERGDEGRGAWSRG